MTEQQLRDRVSTLETELSDERSRLAWWRGFAAAGWGVAVLVTVAFVLAYFAAPVSASAQSAETYAIARADRQQFPVQDYGYIFYLSADAVPDVDQLTLGRTTAFVVSSFSTAVVLEQHLPVEVQRGLWRIDLRALNWRWQDWHAILRDYPYRPDLGLPLVIRADWLTVVLSDEVESDAGPRLLYRGKIPQTVDEGRTFWNVTESKIDPLIFAHIEQESGVSLLRIRRIENAPTKNRGYYWTTEDNRRENFNAATDPLEKLLENRKIDAREDIYGFPKISIAQGLGGMSQAYALFNGAGKRQTRAPVDIVEDAHRFRGFAEIRSSGSCISCHVEGIRPMTTNDLREIIASGVELYASKAAQQKIEQIYLADTLLKLEAQRHQQDYAQFVAMVTGYGPDENARAFRKVVQNYDAPLTVEDASRELYCTPKDLRLALGYASTNQSKLGARLSSLAHDGKIDRSYFESVFPQAYYAVQAWRAVK